MANSRDPLGRRRRTQSRPGRTDAFYYTRVERRLQLADADVQESGRKALREMRGEMIQGTFPVARG